MRHIHRHSITLALFLVPAFLAVAVAQDLGGWVEPEGGWDYVYEAEEGEDINGEFDPALGNSLDGTWTHSNGSDEWDGSGPGDEFRPDGFTPAAPGGAGIVEVAGAAEDGGVASVLSIVDTGDPRSRGFSDPSNRKTWFCHDLFQDLDEDELPIDGSMALRNGLTLIVRSRIHPDVDPAAPGWQLPDGGVDNDAGQGAAPGYTLRDGGKGGHGYYDTALDRNFSFVPFGTNGYQFPPQVGEGLPPANFLDVGDNTVFHSFWVTIEDFDENDRYTVTVYIDGSIDPAEIFEDIQVGDDTDCDGINHLHMGFHSTPQVGGVQVDYFGYKIGLHEPTSFCPGGLRAQFDPGSGAVTLSWSPGAVDSYTLKENGQEIQAGIAAGTTEITIDDPARPSATYELLSVGRDCNPLSVTVDTVVCPELSCSVNGETGEVTLEWTDPAHFNVTGFSILRDGAEVGNAAAAARSFTDSPPPGEYTYELAVASDPADACPENAFCEVRAFAPGAINIIGDVWDQVVFGGIAQKVTTTDGAKSAFFPAGVKTESDIAAFAVDVTSLGAGELDNGRFRVEIRARYDNEIRITNRSIDPESYVHFNLSRTGVSNASNDLFEQETVEQVPSPGGGPTVDSASSTIVNTDTVGLELIDGLNLLEIQPVDGGGVPHGDQIQIFELRIGAFADDLEASIVPFPCPSGFSCVRLSDGRIELSWSSGDPHAYEIERDGELISEIPMGDTTSFIDDPGDGFFTYTLTAVDDDSCPPQTCTGGGGVPNIDGFIQEWLILGPLDYGCVTSPLRGCDNPGVATIETDHLQGAVDGEEVNELDILPEAGMEIVFAESKVKPAPRADINPNAPDAGAWFAYDAGQSLLDHNVAFGGDPGNDYMVYNCTYIENTTGDDLFVNIELTSDDSVQVFVNDLSVWTNNIARGVNLGQLDFVAGVVLEPGLNRVLAKVYEGGGGTGLALRFVDDLGIPLTDVDGLFVRLTAGGTTPGVDMLRADSNGDSRVNIADAQFTLNRLFLGGPAHPCEAQADSNGDGRVNIADAQFTLNRLFLGGPPPPAPHPNCGRSEEAGDLSLGCATPNCP